MRCLTLFIHDSYSATVDSYGDQIQGFEDICCPIFIFFLLTFQLRGGNDTALYILYDH